MLAREFWIAYTGKVEVIFLAGCYVITRFDVCEKGFILLI